MKRRLWILELCLCFWYIVTMAFGAPRPPVFVIIKTESSITFTRNIYIQSVSNQFEFTSKSDSKSVTSPSETCQQQINANVIATIERQFCPTRDEIGMGSYLCVAYKCKDGYRLVGVENNECVNGNWKDPAPECLKTCKNVEIQGITFKANCTHNGKAIDCQSPLRPGTEVVITCAVGYYRQDSSATDFLRCEDTGEWSKRPSSCIQECGRESTEDVVGNSTSIPWHAVIYKRTNMHGFHHVCGGTIISAKLVVSAAHCFSNFTDPRAYKLVVGKHYRPFYESQNAKTQTFDVLEIHVPEEYLGPKGFYYNDISVVVLAGFITYDHHVKPICIEWAAYGSKAILPGTVGKVPNWSQISVNDHITERLMSIQLPALKKSECINNNTKLYKPFVTSEKFCTNSSKKNSKDMSCQGDSGGGFAVSKMEKGVSIYYLWGILSTGIGLQYCKNDYYVIFTNIQYHKQMIVEFESRFRPY